MHILSEDRAVMERDGATEVTAREPESETPLHTIRVSSLCPLKYFAYYTCLPATIQKALCVSKTPL